MRKFRREKKNIELYLTKNNHESWKTIFLKKKSNVLIRALLEAGNSGCFPKCAINHIHIKITNNI